MGSSLLSGRILVHLPDGVDAAKVLPLGGPVPVLRDNSADAQPIGQVTGIVVSDGELFADIVFDADFRPRTPLDGSGAFRRHGDGFELVAVGSLGVGPGATPEAGDGQVRALPGTPRLLHGGTTTAEDPALLHRVAGPSVEPATQAIPLGEGARAVGSKPAAAPAPTAHLLAFAKAWRRVVYANNAPSVNEMTKRARTPELGDLVYETSSFHDQEGRLGYLVAIYPSEDGDTAYTIETLDGGRVRWTNATFIALPGEGW